MDSSSSASDVADVIMPGFGQPSRKKPRRRFNQRCMSSSEEAAVVDRQVLPVAGSHTQNRGVVEDPVVSPPQIYGDGIATDNGTGDLRHDSFVWAGVHVADSDSAASVGQGNGDDSRKEVNPFDSQAVGSGDHTMNVFNGGALEVGVPGRGVKRLTASRLFSFLRNGHSGVEGDEESVSSVGSDGEEEEPASSGFLNGVQCITGIEETEASLWNDGAVQSLYGSRDDFDERLAMMKLALKSSSGSSDEAEPQPIRSFLMLWGILHLVGSKRWKGKDYDDLIRVMSLAVANATFLEDHAWRKNGDSSAAVGTDCAKYELVTGPFLAPSRRTIERLLPALLESVTTRLTYYLVPIDTTKTGGAKIVKETIKAQKKVNGKLEMEKKKNIVNVPVQGEMEVAADFPEAVVADPQIRVAPVTGGRNCPTEVRAPDVGGVVAVA